MEKAARRRFIITWLILSALGAGVASLIWPAAHLGDELLPVGNDSFYHARRILDAVAQPDAFYEFDPRIHAPEGSLLTWPWGYDYVMASIVRFGLALGLAEDPMALLVWIPVAAVFISIGLIFLITRRLGLPLWGSALAGFCVALSPLTQYIHGVGFIDHHFAEYIFVLASIAAGLTWFAELSSVRRAALVGFVLGAAPAVHNALFVLQIPLLAAFFVFWLQGMQAPRRAVATFCTALFLTTVAVLAPSAPFRMGMAAYYLLSWFHLYVACGTILVCTFLCMRPPQRSSYLMLAAMGIVLLTPIGVQISMAGEFLAGKLMRLDAIAEMMSLRRYLRFYGPFDLMNRYSAFIWLAPATFVYCIYMGWRRRSSHEIVFWISAVGGLALLAMQFRLHYFGSFALYIPWFVVAKEAAERWSAHHKKVALAAASLTILMYAPPTRNQLLGPMLHANDEYFLSVRPVLASLAKECKEDPGVVLADNDVGHYITYYTDCSVIANNFLLTEQHARKILEMERLFATSARDLPKEAPYVKYVLVRPLSLEETDAGPRYMSYSTGSSDLVADLLLQPVGTPPVAPPEFYELLHEARIRSGEEDFPYARLYRVRSPARAGS